MYTNVLRTRVSLLRLHKESCSRSMAACDRRFLVYHGRDGLSVVVNEVHAVDAAEACTH